MIFLYSIGNVKTLVLNRIVIFYLIQHVYDNCGAAIIVFDLNDLRTAKEVCALGNNIKIKAENFPTKFFIVGNKVR